MSYIHLLGLIIKEENKMREKLIAGLINSADSILEVAKTGNKLAMPVYYLFSLVGMAISLPITILVTIPFISNAHVRSLLIRSINNTIRMVGISFVGMFLSPLSPTSFIIVTIESLEASLNGYGTSLKMYDRPYDEKTVKEYLAA